MPRSHAQTRLSTRSSEIKSKKRKRNNDEEELGKNKKFKNSWLRDIRSVLRSASNRQVKTENDVNIQTNIQNENNTDQNESIANNTNEYQEQTIPGNRMQFDECSPKNDTLKELCSEKLDIIQTSPQAIKEKESKVEDCIFETITCQANGTMIRLENIPPSVQTPKTSIGMKHENPEYCCNIPDRFINDVEENEETKLVNREDSLNNFIEGSEIEEISDEQLLDIEVNEEELHNFETQNNIDSNLNQLYFDKTLNNESYFFGNDNSRKLGRLDVGYVFALGQNVGERSEIDEGLTTSNAVTLDVNGIESIENLLTFDSELNTTTIDNCDQMWMGICGGDCSQQNGCLQENEEYPINFTGNSRIENESELIENEPKTSQAYYDANRGAFVDASILQEPKPGNSSKTIMNTWDSIKNLISRVSGQKTSNASEDDNSNKTEDNL